MGVRTIFAAECDGCNRTIVDSSHGSGDAVLLSALDAGWTYGDGVLTCDVCATPIDEPIHLTPTRAPDTP